MTADKEHGADEFLTDKELAARWKRTARTLYNMRKYKGLPFHTLGGGIRYRLSEIEEYERAHAGIFRKQSGG